MLKQENDQTAVAGPTRENLYKFRLRGKILSRSKSVSAVTPTLEALRLSGRERRRINRVLYEIFPESAADSPLYNSPISGCRPGPHLIAIAGMMIAIQELDRLSFLANALFPRQEPAPTRVTWSKALAAPGSIPNTGSGISSVSHSVPTTPFVPPNSPTSSEDNATCAATSPDQVGAYGRAWKARRRLSEISMTADIPEEQSEFEPFPEFHLHAGSCFAQTPQSLPMRLAGG